VKRILELDAYVTGELDAAAADALEEAMFDAPDDEDLDFVDRMARHGARLVAHSTFDIGVTRAQLDKLIGEGHKVHLMNAGPPGTNTLIMSRTAELIASVLQIGRTDLERVDVEIFIERYGVTKVLKDVLVDQSEGIVIGLCEQPLARLALTAGPTITKVRETTGARAVIGEWRIDSHLEDAPAT
jgi:hypothetical protein